jgi:hypothetical protein
VIRIYDSAGNLIETHERRGRVQGGELVVPSNCVFEFVSGLAAHWDDPQPAASYPLVRITNNRTAPTKPDYTQTGQIEIR